MPCLKCEYMKQSFVFDIYICTADKCPYMKKGVNVNDETSEKQTNNKKASS